MPVTRAYALLPVLPTDLPSLEASLEHLVAAADESAAAGVPTTLVLSTPAGAAALRPVLDSWAPLVRLLDGVDLTLDHQPGATTRAVLLARTARALTATISAPATTVVLTTTCDVGVETGWIAEHVRHHRGGAVASTGPVRGGGPRHEATANLAVRADLLPTVVELDAPGLQRVPLVHAVTPVVAALRVILPAFP